jgi:hypothetical protein
MDYLDIVKENDNFRVRLEIDQSPEKPYDEGAVPILSREHRWGTFDAVNDQAEEYVSLINALYDRFDEDVIERFIRIFLGAYSVMWDSSSNCRYLAFDTTAWREKVGLTEEWLNSTDNDRSKLAEGSLQEIMAWAEGEVYGYIVEKKFSTVTRYIDPVTHFEVNETEDEEWIEVEDGSVWGHYGRKWAEESATEAFDAEVKRAEES